MADGTYTFRVSSKQRQISGYWQALHAIAIAACWLNGLGYGYRILLTLGVFVSWQRGYKQSTQGSSCCYLRYTALKHWTLSGNGEDFSPVSIDPTTFLSPWLIILHYRLQNTGQLNSGTLLITRQALEQDEYRRLRVMLKLSRNDRN